MKKLYFLLLFAISFKCLIAGITNDTIIAGLPVNFNYKVNIFPIEWQIEPINAYGVQIESSEIARTKFVMISALEKYPVQFLQNNLTAIYFMKKMEFYGVDFGGTNSNDIIYLTNAGEYMGYTNAYIEQTFHHEFSSILLRNFSGYIDRKSWQNISDAGNTDPEGGVGAIRNGSASTEIDTALSAFGFLTQYSLSDFENDVNMLAQNLFEPFDDFWDIVDQYPKLKMKVDLLIDFYNHLDPAFTEAYFRKLEQE